MASQTVRSRAWCYVLSATPAFWLALLALMVFSVYLGWFPVGFAAPIGAAGEVSLAARLHHMALPALVLSLTGIANVALHTREKTIEVLGSDYARFARARGEGEGSIVVRHGVRNLVLPAISLLCAQVGELVGGSVLVEQVFSYPGLGQAAVTAGLGGDALAARGDCACHLGRRVCGQRVCERALPRGRPASSKRGWTPCVTSLPKAVSAPALA